jgi:hypothetical protein
MRFLTLFQQSSTAPINFKANMAQDRGDGQNLLRRGL